MIKITRIIFFFSIALLFVLTSCTPAVTGPVINTAETSAVTQTTATCGGNIVSDGGTSIIERGVCWSTMPAPTVHMNKTSDGTGTGSFVSAVEFLNPASTYYIRAYATTADEITYYGNSLIVTTLPEENAPNNILNPDLTYGSVTDVDGNEYHTITIGTQTWMAENLRVTKYRNGEAIPAVTDNTKWSKLTGGAQCAYYNNSESNSIAKFGRLYNYYAVSDSRNIAPQGWHVASDEEWTILSNYLAANQGISKSVAQALAAKPDWRESTIPGAVGCLDPDTYSSLNNSSGFCALPAGGRFIYGGFNNVADYCGWWASNGNDKTNAWFRSLNYYGATVGRNTTDKQYGLSVRCVKD
ncbi:MAG TPA: fibrobacter succinogenes major paralogous domain-containing protein [Paludibacter sp.]|nr:fibrobacter succinogenes major paralogous domain-containing protein [Paludibacter sp.]